MFPFKYIRNDSVSCLGCKRIGILPILSKPRTNKEGNKVLSQEREMVELVRSIMYSGTAGPDDKDNTFYDEVVDLADKLARYDGVKISPSQNRLIQMMDELKKHPDIWSRIEHLNDD